MGIVYRAEDLRLKRKVALKLLAPELAADDRFRDRFLVESELAAGLEHPNIVPIYSAGEAHGQLYIAMRYVEGPDLGQLLRREGPLEARRAVALVTQLADALDAAHARGLVHRDVKPSNALVDAADHVYLSDFGLTQTASDRSGESLTGRVVGTVDYASPEQITGEAVEGRADVYSLGCLLYECLVGEVPFRRDSELAVLWAHVHEEPPSAHERRPELPAGIDRVLATALAKDPHDRYETCAELVEGARDALGARDVVVVRDRRPLVLLGVGLLAAAAIAAGVVLSVGGRARTQPDLTVRRNTLVRLDPKTNRITHVTGVGSAPESVAVGGGAVWAYNWDDGTVSEVAARTGALRRTIAVAGSSPNVPAQTIAADASGAWVVSSSNGTGLLTHVRPGLVNKTFPLQGDLLTLADGGHAIWVGARTPRGSAVLKVSPDTGLVVKSFPLGSSDIQSIAVGDRAVWSLTVDGTLFRIDPASARVAERKRLPTGGRPVAALAVGYGAVWALLGGPAALLRIDPRTLETTTVPAPVVPSGGTYGGGTPNLAIGSGAVWWSGVDTGTIWRLDPHSLRIVKTIRISPPVNRQDALRPLELFEPLGTAAGAGGVWVSISRPF
jgi:serine/threonine-protein kinase